MVVNNLGPNNEVPWFKLHSDIFADFGDLKNPFEI